MKKTFTYSNASIVYQTEGEGIPVVLLHGFGEDAGIWNQQVNFLKNHYRLIVPHFPGSGESVFLTNKESPATTPHPPCTIEFYADCIYALLAHENITSCIMLGHSMGGYVALAFAEAYPQLLKGYGLIHSTAFADSAEKKQNRQRSIEMIEQYGSYPFLKNTIPNLFGESYKKEHAEKVNALIEQGNNFLPQALKQYSEAMMLRPDRTRVLKNTNLPVLFIMGTEDIATPMKDVLQQVHLPGIAYIHIFENTGHMGMLESAEKMNSAILEFIKGITLE